MDMPVFSAALPEIVMLAMACVTLLLGVFCSQARRLVFGLTLLTLVASLILVLKFYPSQRILAFNDSFVVDPLACLLKVFVLLSAFIAFVYSRLYVASRDMPHNEYYALGLFAVLGMMVMVSAHSLLTVYLGLELMSLPLYAMTALQRDNSNCSEAAMKYFVMGALASGMLLYGMSMIYGGTQSLAFNEIARVIDFKADSQYVLLIFGLIFIVAGLAFKLGAVPFHMWVPDVYQGAPNSVTVFIASAPKIAAVGMIIRLLTYGLGGLAFEWQELFMVLAILSMAVGNILAISQTNIKRLLAYSAIGHAGYLSLGLVAGTAEGSSAMVFYVLSYAIMSLGAFGVVLLLSRAGFEAEELEDYRGLNSRNPWLAFLMLLLMFSMAGMPPTLGFFAKLAILNALVHTHQVWLAVVALMFAVIGAYVYLRVIKTMYFDEPVEQTAIKISTDMRMMININGLAILILGLYPAALLEACRAAFA